MSRPVVGFAGMTHLGINSAAGALQRGFQVVGFDPDKPVIEALKAGRPPVDEPGLVDALSGGKQLAAFTADAAGLARCDVVYISTDVATDDEGRSDLGPVRSLIARVTPALQPGATLVVLCQVPPGFTRALALPPERLYYQVETLVFGQALERAFKPERFIVGCAAPERPLPPAYAAFLQAFGCPVLPMRYESAELAKIAINCCLVASVSVANTLAELCERIGADWSEITPALRLDRRIGAHAYLNPGLGIAGGNLERDLATVIRFAAEHGTDAGVVKAWVANSRHRRDWAARTLREAVLASNPAASVAVWGLTYKENTNSTKNSPSLATLARFPDRTFRRHDPVLEPGEGPLAAARGADALMILTPWPEYRKVPLAELRKAMRGNAILDPYAVLDRAEAARQGFVVHTLGRAAAHA